MTNQNQDTRTKEEVLEQELESLAQNILLRDAALCASIKAICEAIDVDLELDTEQQSDLVMMLQAVLAELLEKHDVVEQCEYGLEMYRERLEEMAMWNQELEHKLGE